MKANRGKAYFYAKGQREATLHKGCEFWLKHRFKYIPINNLSQWAKIAFHDGYVRGTTQFRSNNPL